MRTSADIVDDLHALTGAAELEPPFVLIGHSFGGYNVRLFQSRYPDEVAGLVLMDTVTPGFVAGQEALLTPDQWAIEAATYLGRTEPYIDFLASGDEVAAADPPDEPCSRSWWSPPRSGTPAMCRGRRTGRARSWTRCGIRSSEASPSLDARTRTLVIAADTAHRIHIQRPGLHGGPDRRRSSTRPFEVVAEAVPGAQPLRRSKSRMNSTSASTPASGNAL